MSCYKAGKRKAIYIRFEKQNYRDSQWENPDALIQVPSELCPSNPP